jgi:Cdc6-like AAA superfamily ATPase
MPAEKNKAEAGKMESLNQFIAEVEERQEKLRKAVRNSEVFDFNYIPQKIFIRQETRQIIENILSFESVGVPNNMFIYGARGSGKTVILKYLTSYLAAGRKLSVPVRFVNCRHHNTSLKILAEILGIEANGLGAAELYHKLIKTHDKLIIVLDEADLISRKERTADILYYLSRAEKKYMLILLSNNPSLYRRIDEATKSSLQLENLYFKNYNGEEMLEILRNRCEEGVIRDMDSYDLARIAGMASNECNSDARIAIKALQYLTTQKYEDIRENFDKAKKDILVELLANQSDQVILILTAALKSPDKLVKSVYFVYSITCKEQNIKPFTYQHFYNQLSYLQSTGLIMLISTREKSGNPNKIETLFDHNILSQIYQYRFS